MDKNGIVGEVLERGQNTISDSAKTAASDLIGSAQDISTSVQTQVGIKDSAQNITTNEDLEKIRETVREFYSPNVQDNSTQGMSDEQAQVQLQRDREELQKIINKRKMEQHGEEYFEPLQQATIQAPNSEQERKGPEIANSDVKKELPPLTEPVTRPKRGMISVKRRKLSAEGRDMNGSG